MKRRLVIRFNAPVILSFALLSLLMAYVKKRQKQQSDELDDE